MTFKPWLIRSLRTLMGLTAALFLASCGGGTSPVQDQAQEPSIAFQISYFPYRSPSGNSTSGLLVKPIPGRLTLASQGVAKVQFLLFGHDAQALDRTNSMPQVPPEERFFFELPADFKPGVYSCGTGANLSEVRVTDAAGQTVSQVFELCPAMPMDFSPSFSPDGESPRFPCACDGIQLPNYGGSAPPSPLIAFQLHYTVPDTPSGHSHITVRQLEDWSIFAPAGVAKVELLLYGYDVQTLMLANAGPESGYEFALPANFQPDLLACSVGLKRSVVQVTDNLGNVLSQTFEICSGPSQDFPPVSSWAY